VLFSGCVSGPNQGSIQAVLDTQCEAIKNEDVDLYLTTLTGDEQSIKFLGSLLNASFALMDFTDCKATVVDIINQTDNETFARIKVEIKYKAFGFEGSNSTESMTHFVKKDGKWYQFVSGFYKTF